MTESSGLILLVVGAIVLAFSIGRLFSRPARHGGERAGEGGAARLREEADREIERMDEFARSARAEVETKIHLLNALLVRAERVLALLKSAEAPQPEPTGKTAEIYRLADEGLDSAAIASRTEFERGEIEMLLSMRRKSAEPPGASARKDRA